MSDAVATTKRPLREDLAELGKAPRELWLIFLAKYLESLAYFSMTKMLVLWLSKDFGYSDIAAGWWVSLFSSIVTLLTVAVGFVGDAWGFRRVLILAFGTAIFARGIMALAPTRGIAIAGLMAITFGTAATIPVMTTAVRRYTPEKSRSFGFSFYYVVMNIGSASAGFMIDWARGLFAVPGKKDLVPKMIALPLLGPTRISAYGLVFAIGFLCAVLAFFVSLLIRKDVDLEAKEETPTESPVKIAKELFGEKPFHRFLLFVGLLAVVRLMFQHAFMTFPKYVTREMGAAYPFGKVWAINPIMIIILVPIVTALTRHRSAFSCIVAGAFISALSPFVLCLGATHATFVGMVVVLSLGEALWSPRVYEYAATIAPRGRESSYMGLSYLPLFVAKIVVGPLSGFLLAHYVPENAPRRSEIMWLIIGVMTLIGPVLMLFLRRTIEASNERPVGPDPNAAEGQAVGSAR
jgi:dipeptide/tripeptide permease